MNALEIIEEVRAHEAELAVEDGRLFVRGQGAPLPAELRQRLAEHKVELLAALGEPIDSIVDRVLRDIRPHLAPALCALPDDQLLGLVSWHIVSAWEAAVGKAGRR